jgi:Protein of unknown function (DUF2867)
MSVRTPTECEAPHHSVIAKRIAGAYFHDTWRVQSEFPELSAFEHYLKAASETPRWVDSLMSLRNRVVAIVGLKNLGNLAAIDKAKLETDYNLGDRVGIFKLLEIHENEVLLGDDDSHLNAVISIHRAQASMDAPVFISATTVVRVHNLVGRLYLLPVVPLHRRIVPAVMRGFGKR